MAPAELENLVRSLDGVADCAVLGIPHPRAGQVFDLKFSGIDDIMFEFNVIGQSRWFLHPPLTSK